MIRFYRVLLLFGAFLSGTNYLNATPTSQSPLRERILQKLKTQPTVKLELYVMSQCPFGVQAEQALIPVVKEFGSKVDFRLHYIVAPMQGGTQLAFRSLHGPAEIAENLRQLLIAERFPNQWLDYLLARANNYQTNDWQAAARNVGIDVDEVARLAGQPSALERLIPHSNQTLARNIRSSPTVFVDEEPYQGPLQNSTTVIRSAAGCTQDADCNDSNRCTADACDLTSGACVFTLINCDDNNACTTDSCDPIKGCRHTPVSCDDNNACTMDSCDPIKGCRFEPKTCDDGNPGTINSCDPTQGCTYTPISRVYVNQAVATSNDGTSWDQAFKTLTEALTAASSYTTITEIWIAAGTYKPTTSTTDRNATFSMKNGVAIYGGFVGNEVNLSDRPAVNPVSGQPSSTTLSGDIDNDDTQTGNSYTIFKNSQLTTSAVLDGVVIRGAQQSAIFNDGYNQGFCSPRLINCLFVANSANQGGAIYNNGSYGTSSPVLTNCLFVANSSSINGGAIFNNGFSGTSSPVLTNCSFEANSASHKGGAIYNYGTTGTSSLTLINCSFGSNTAPDEGGAINLQNSQAILINCGFLANQTNGSGGAIFSYGSTLRVINGSFQNNTASSGSAVNTFNGVATLTNSVAFGNGGSNTFANQVNNGNPSGFTATYSLFEPTSVTVTGMDVSGPGNLTTTSSPFASTATLALNQCAPAINTGSNDAYSSANGPAKDLNGQARNYNGSTIDMGAIEYQGTPNGQTGFTSQLASASGVCMGTTVTASVSVSGTGPFSYQWYKDGSAVNTQTSATLSLTNVQTSDGGSYSVVVTGSCNSLTSTAFSLTVNAIPTVSINPTSATLTSASPTVSLTAIGSGSYLWSTGETSQVISVTSSGVYSVTLTSPGGCSATTTASVPGADLTVSLELPQAQFGLSGTAAVGNLVVNVFEVGGLATSSGNVTITITAPAGYTLSFSPTLNSMAVSGGNTVEVNNEQWSVINSVESRQLTLRMSSGTFINGGGKSRLGFSVTRTTANSGSTSNITVNVADDLTMTYDGNLANNVYARIISGL